jgi:hypothetical protein
MFVTVVHRVHDSITQRVMTSNTSKAKVLGCTGIVALTLGSVAVFGCGPAAAAVRPTTLARPAAAPASGKGAVTPSVRPPKRTAPTDYQIVSTGELDNSPGQENFGSIECPAKTVVLGGGVTDTGATGEVINSSWPSESYVKKPSRPKSTAWNVYIENAGATDESFDVYAVCAKQAKWSIQSVTANNPAGAQTAVFAACPAGAVVLSGGAFSSDAGRDFTINSTSPVGSPEWGVEMNNTSGVNDTVTDYALCGKQPKSYSINESAPMDNPPGSLTMVSETCPPGSSILGAGLYSNAGSPDVALNELLADGSAVGFEANNSGIDGGIYAFSICAA